MRYLFLFLLLFVGATASAQTVVQGTLTDSLGAAVPGASVTLSTTTSSKLLGYSITDASGYYKISATTDADSLLLHFRLMGFKAQVRRLQNFSQTHNTVFQEEVTQIKEVEIKADPIIRNGDTLSFNLAPFTDENDRTIGDVLRKMPGIEIEPSGRILYQGKPINKYYVEGLDLMGGQYDLINQNLPHDKVAQVQVLENHQPIKVLDSLERSDQAAINLELKNKYTLTGQAQAGAGGTPFIYEGKLSGILFAPGQQALVSGQSNNSGRDIGAQLDVLSFEDYQNGLYSSKRHNPRLSVQQVNSAQLPRERWWNNNSHLLTANLLQPLKNDYQLRLNLSGLHNQLRQEGFTATTFFLPADTVFLPESINTTATDRRLRAKLTIERNAANNFFYNASTFERQWNEELSSVLRPDQQVGQQLRDDYYRLENTFKTKFKVAGKLVSFNSYLNYAESPQRLQLNTLVPFLSQAALANETAVLQRLDEKGFVSLHSAKLTLKKNFFTISPEVGIQYENKDLQSELLAEGELPQNFGNNLNWQYTKAYTQLRLRLEKSKWDISSELPLSYNRYRLQDRPLARAQQLDAFVAEPSARISYEPNLRWEFYTNYNRRFNFGEFGNVHYGYLLSSYRSLQLADAPLPETLSNSYSAGIKYANALSGFFANGSYSYSRRRNNLLFNNEILPDGSAQLTATALENYSSSHSLNGKVGTFFSELSLNLSVSASLSRSQSEQLLNSLLTNATTTSYSGRFKFDIDLGEKLNLEHEASYSRFSNQFAELPTNSFSSQQFNSKLAYFIAKGNSLILKSEITRNQLPTQRLQFHFIDLTYRYSFKSVDFELTANNLLDNRQYEIQSLGAFTRTESSVELRPRQFLVSVRFSL